MKSQSGLTKALVILLLLALGQQARANRDSVLEWTFHGSSISHFRTLSDVDWRAANGKIARVLRNRLGGWRSLDSLPQDTQFSATFRCTAGWRAGVMLRTEGSPKGIRGAYVEVQPVRRSTSPRPLPTALAI
jgi:hypothetical protein